MSDIVNKYKGKRLTTDEAATAKREISEAIEQLEGIDYTTGGDYLQLKWGTLKEWNLHSDKARKLLKRYGELGTNMSAIAQKDTDEQKSLICQIIDEVDGTIQNDWDGEYYTKQEAKEYVLGYGKELG